MYLSIEPYVFIMISTSFFANGAVGLLCNWIAGEHDVTKEYLAKTILALGIKGAEYFFNEQPATLPVIKITNT